MTSTPRNTRNSGVRILPTHVRIFPGKSEKPSTAAKNSAENTASAGALPAPLPSSGSTPTVNGTAAQRGMAKNGPMVR